MVGCFVYSWVGGFSDNPPVAGHPTPFVRFLIPYELDESVLLCLSRFISWDLEKYHRVIPYDLDLHFSCPLFVFISLNLVNDGGLYHVSRWLCQGTFIVVFQNVPRRLISRCFMFFHIYK